MVYIQGSSIDSLVPEEETVLELESDLEAELCFESESDFGLETELRSKFGFETESDLEG